MMMEQFVRLDEEHLLFLAAMVVLASGLSTILVGIVAIQVRKLRERQLELGFKNDLLRRGFSVDEAVRLATSRRPSWSQSVMVIGDWMAVKISQGWQRVTDTLPRLLRPCRRLLRVAQNTSMQLWCESRPLLRWTMMSVNDCVHWLGNQTDRLVRRLTPYRP